MEHIYKDKKFHYLFCKSYFILFAPYITLK